LIGLKTTEAEGYECGAQILRPSGEKHYYQDNQDDSADPDSTIRSVRVITAATAKQQQQDQDQ
jgi:hypothetical protein